MNVYELPSNKFLETTYGATGANPAPGGTRALARLIILTHREFSCLAPTLPTGPLRRVIF